MDFKGILLGIVTLLLCGSLYLQYESTKQIKSLHHDNIVLWNKLDSVQAICNKKPAKPAAAPKQQASTGNVLLDLFNVIAAEEQAAEAKQKFKVETKYRLEDRYSSHITKPDYLGNQAGEVVLSVLVGKYGSVKTAKLQSATGINDEEVIEACKKAALQSSFNSNYDAEEAQPGTITYIIKRK